MRLGVTYIKDALLVIHLCIYIYLYIYRGTYIIILYRRCTYGNTHIISYTTTSDDSRQSAYSRAVILWSTWRRVYTSCSNYRGSRIACRCTHTCTYVGGYSRIFSLVFSRGTYKLATEPVFASFFHLAYGQLSAVSARAVRIRKTTACSERSIVGHVETVPKMCTEIQRSCKIVTPCTRFIVIKISALSKIEFSYRVSDVIRARVSCIGYLPTFNDPTYSY